MNFAMGNNIFSPFYAAYNTAVKSGCSYSKEELVEQFTNGRTCSLRQLSPGELRELVLTINRLTNNPTQPPLRGEELLTPEQKKRDGMRKAIIAQFKFIGKTTGDAIAWAEKYGCHGVKRKFNEYSEQELYVLIRNAEKMKEDFIHQLRINN